MKRKKELQVRVKSGVLLSIGIIVKNEERCIERCLKSLEPLRNALPCEVVVADTGSTDSTKKIAGKYADLVYDFNWINDFAAARNDLTSKCTGEWCLQIDADEYLDEDISELVNALKNDKNYNFDCATVIIKNYKDLSMQNCAYSQVSVLRLFKISSGIKFDGKIHEALKFGKNNRYLLLDKTILHHDGYAKNRTDEQKDLKAERNLSLLEEKLRENPNDIPTIIQCVESCSVNMLQRRLKYTNMGMGILRALDKDEVSKVEFGAALYSHALMLALVLKTDDIDSLIKFGAEYFSDTIYYKLDCAYVLAKYYFSKEQYELGVEFADLYINTFNYRMSDDFDAKLLVGPTLIYANEFEVVDIQLLKVLALLKKEDKKAATNLLLQVDVNTINDKNIENYLNTLQMIASEEVAQDLMKSLYKKIKLDENAMLKEMFDLVLLRTLNNDSSLFSKLYSKCEGDIGLAAKMVQADANELALVAGKVESWDDIPPAAIAKYFENCTALPNEFYNRQSDKIVSTAKDLAQFSSVLSRVEKWKECDDFTGDIKKENFLLELTLDCLMHAQWGEENAQQEINMHEKSAICVGDIMVNTAKSLLPKIYSSSILQNEAVWCVLPKKHNLALVFVKAQDAKIKGETKEYISALRGVLKLSFEMHKYVNLLLKNVETQYAQPQMAEKQVSKELEALVSQMRAILATNPKDSAIVQTILKSEAYEKIKHLL